MRTADRWHYVDVCVQSLLEEIAEHYDLRVGEYYASESLNRTTITFSPRTHWPDHVAVRVELLTSLCMNITHYSHARQHRRRP